MFYQAPLSLNPSCEPRYSFFSRENSNVDLRGFFNLAILLMFSNNFMLILDNFLKYGFLIRENFVTLSLNLTDHGFYLGQLFLVLLFIMSYYLMYLNSVRKVNNSLRVFLEGLLVTSILLLPIFMNLIFRITFCSPFLTQSA